VSAPAATATAVNQTPEQRAREESSLRTSAARDKINALLEPLTADEAEHVLGEVVRFQYGPDWRDELKCMAEREK